MPQREKWVHFHSWYQTHVAIIVGTAVECESEYFMRQWALEITASGFIIAYHFRVR